MSEQTAAENRAAQKAVTDFGRAIRESMLFLGYTLAEIQEIVGVTLIRQSVKDRRR